MALGKNITWKKGKENQYHLSNGYQGSCWEEYQVGKRGRLEICGKKIKILKHGVGKNIKKVQEKLYIVQCTMIFDNLSFK